VADSQKLRDLPAVHEVWEHVSALLARFPRQLVIDQIRRTLAQIRNGASVESIEIQVEAELQNLEVASLRGVINATGVVLHTNLGRAPVGPTCILPGYSNLEYDLATGRRGKRDVHLSPLLERLLGVPGIAVNNNAAALLLALNELASGGEVIV